MRIVLPKIPKILLNLYVEGIAVAPTTPKTTYRIGQLLVDVVAVFSVFTIFWGGNRTSFEINAKRY